MEAFRRFTELEADLPGLGADFEPERVVSPVDGEASHGWVVVAVDRLLNGRPALRDVFGPFRGLEEARCFGDQIEENGTRIFVAALRDPSRFA